MYSIMIVDDEMLARIGIKVLIPWEEYGFQLLGEYDNGRKALDAARIARPDIIITDIKMPVLDGIELIKQLRISRLDTKVIIMSSYDDFHLVKEAMQLGAQDYMLKLEIEAATLVDILKKTATALEQEREEKVRHMEFEKQFSANIPILKDTFLKNILLGNIVDLEHIEKEIKLYQLPAQGRALTCLLVHIQNSEFYEELIVHNESLLISSITNIIEDASLNVGSGAVTHIRQGMFATVVSVKSGQMEELEKLASNIKEVLKKMLNVTVTIGISRFFTHYHEAREKFHEAVSQLQIWSGLQSSNESDQPASVSLPLEKELKQLEDQLKALRVEDIDLSFHTIIERIEEMKALPQHISYAIGHVLIYILSSFITKQLKKDHNIWTPLGYPYEQLVKLKTNKDLVVWVTTVKNKMNTLLNEAKDEKLMIIKAKKYISDHFSHNISLADVACHLGLSASYFSRLFSREVNQTFIEYVTQLRVEFAKELLHSSNYKTYEISEMVGYVNPHYFFRIFKKMTGSTPGEYKEYLLKQT